MTQHAAKRRAAGWARKQALDRAAANWNPFRGIPLTQYLIFAQARERGAIGTFDFRCFEIGARSVASAIDAVREAYETNYIGGFFELA